jgi:flagellar motor switch protein FliN/FliY
MVDETSESNEPLSQADINAALAAGGAADDAAADTAGPADGQDVQVEQPVEADVTASQSSAEPDTAVDGGAVESEEAVGEGAEPATDDAGAAAGEPAAEVASAEEPVGQDGIDQPDLPDFQASQEPGLSGPGDIALLKDVDLAVKIELGRCQMFVEDVLKLAEGSVVELDKLAGDPVDVLVNDRLVARGEVLVLNDNFCVRISDIVQPVDDGSKS